VKPELKIPDEKLAYSLLRIFVGLNLMMHGVSRLMAGAGQFAAKLDTQFSHTMLPAWSIHVFGLVLPPIEALLGFLLLIGLRTRVTLIAAMIWLAILTFGSSLIQDWAAAGTQLVYALAFALLLFLRRFNALSVDSLL
jgi:thiosulfate dehydrogenase (quinone) large subunit